jgi:hypothetical protein
MAAAALLFVLGGRPPHTLRPRPQGEGTRSRPRGQTIALPKLVHFYG